MSTNPADRQPDKTQDVEGTGVYEPGQFSAPPPTAPASGSPPEKTPARNLPSPLFPK